jgi:site-specific recombinase XerD
MRPFPISQQWARKLVKRYGAVIGKYMHLHSFSHSFAINIVRHGVDIRRLQQGWDTRR